MKFYRQWQPVQALSFDLDDTLYNNEPIIAAAEAWLYHHLKHDVFASANLTISDWQRYKQRVLQAQPKLHHDVSACRIAWLILAFRELKVEQPERLAQQVFDQFIYQRSDFSVPASSIALLEALAKKYRLVAITNGNVDLAQIGLDKHFELALKAGGDYKAKPDADLFNAAADYLELAPSQIAHVGDHPITDVQGAVQAGYRSIWLNLQGDNSRLRCLPDLEISDISDLLHFL